MRLGMGQRLRRPALTVTIPVILIGLAGSAFALSKRSADSLFVYRQQNLAVVQPAQLAHLVSLTSDPRPGMGHTHATAASCTPAGTGELRNPWSCAVSYERGAAVHYSVTISPAGSVQGVDPTGQLIVHGCCVRPGSSPQ